MLVYHTGLIAVPSQLCGLLSPLPPPTVWHPRTVTSQQHYASSPSLRPFTGSVLVHKPFPLGSSMLVKEFVVNQAP